MATAEEIKRYQEHLEDELNSTALYLSLAEKEKNPRLAEVYRRLSATEQSHADAWIVKLKEAGVTLPPFKPTWRTRTLAWLSRRFGAEAVLPSLAAMETTKSQDYRGQADVQSMIAQEQSHARLLRQIGANQSGGMAGPELAKLEGRHRTAGGNALRAAVLGANDGLVSNFSLVMGVAGAAIANQTILLTGFAGLLAGAISMALGEWISVQSSRELYLKQIATEKEEIEQSPQEEADELALIYQARGLEEAPARKLAQQIMSNRETALLALTRDELGCIPPECIPPEYIPTANRLAQLCARERAQNWFMFPSGTEFAWKQQ